MTHHFDLRNTDMPEEMRLLAKRYPREDWSAHPGFAEKTRQWLRAHQMFRRLGEVLREDAEDYLDHKRDGDDFAARLSIFGGRLVGNLHGHHAFEDHSYFPELSRADPRFDAGLDILEKDHEVLNSVLDAFTESANRAIKLIQLDPGQAREEVGRLHGLEGTIEAFLDRHLSDEEELAVPIILHHRLRG